MIFIRCSGSIYNLKLVLILKYLGLHYQNFTPYSLRAHGEYTVHDNLQNPSEALFILAHAAGQPEDLMRSDANKLDSRRDKVAPVSFGQEKPIRDIYNHSDATFESRTAMRYCTTAQKISTWHALVFDGTLD